jgi:exodeoxyribonuclease III
VLKKNPTALSDLCEKHDLDMLCLQETKLQDIHLDDPKLKLRGIMDEHGYDEYWNCSTGKKGYSGTAVFVKKRGKTNGGGTKKGKQTTIGSFFAPEKKQDKKAKESNGVELSVCLESLSPTEVTYNLGKEIDNEGRTVIVDFLWGTLVNVYVPNSGQKLERLDFRTEEWDKFFVEYMQKKQKERGLPVMWLGDLNIAHKSYDVWNDGAKHLDKQAGVTPQERQSFTEQLQAGYFDIFRELHPEAKGNYSYWSQRAGNREPNKGLRLDYFVCSPEFLSEDSKVVARDSYMIFDQQGSDHCPVVLELEIKP